VLGKPKQVLFGTPAVGAAITGQAQFGALTAKVVVQPFSIEVKVTLVPAVIPVSVLAELSTVPVVELTVPLLTNTME
jgi:hypothetical protein